MDTPSADGITAFFVDRNGENLSFIVIEQDGLDDDEDLRWMMIKMRMKKIERITARAAV